MDSEKIIQFVLQIALEIAPYLPFTIVCIGFGGFMVLCIKGLVWLIKWSDEPQESKRKRRVARELQDLFEELPPSPSSPPKPRKQKRGEMVIVEDIHSQMMGIANSLPKTEALKSFVKRLPKPIREAFSGNIAYEELQMLLNAAIQEMEAILEGRNIELKAALANQKSDLTTRTSITFYYRGLGYLLAMQKVRQMFDGQLDEISQRQSARMLDEEFRRVDAVHRELLAKIDPSDDQSIQEYYRRLRSQLPTHTDTEQDEDEDKIVLPGRRHK